MTAIELKEFPEKISTEIIKVDFRNEKSLEKKKKILIFYSSGENEEREIFKRPSFAELVGILGGYPARCSVRYQLQTRTMLYNPHGCLNASELNFEATSLRTMAKIDPRFQVFGTAILIFGYRYGKI